MLLILARKANKKSFKIIGICEHFDKWLEYNSIDAFVEIKVVKVQDMTETCKRILSNGKQLY